MSDTNEPNFIHATGDKDAISLSKTDRRYTNSHVVELVAGSLRGLIALAQAQNAKVAGAAIRSDGLWRMQVTLPEKDLRK